MKFFALAVLSLCVVARAADEARKPAIQLAEIASPAGPRALGASIAKAPDGTWWLSWVEAANTPAPAATPPSGEHHHGASTTADAAPHTLRFSRFDAATNTWTAARTIAVGHGVPTSSADFPQLAFEGNGRALALWPDGRGGAWFTHSTDRGATWTEPAPWMTDGTEVEKFSFATLADGRVLAAWLDGRAKKSGGKNQQLFARIVGEKGPDLLIDPSVCDCCQTTLTAFPDGTALIAYRGRTEDEVRDIRVARFRGRAWDDPRPLNNDDWRIAACPINGPRLASDGGRVGVAWFTAADNDPRVLASFSPDAGGRFLQPLRMDGGKPAGHVDTLLLHDGAMLVTWIEGDGSAWLRRVTPDFTPGEPVRLAAAGTVPLNTVPRAALLRDYAGGETSALAVVAFASRDALRTVLVHVPEGALIEAEKNCDCAPSAEQLQGYPLQGTVAAAQGAAGMVRIRHLEVPGIFSAGTHDFKAAPEILAAAQPGRTFLGRIEKRDGTWWLFDVRLMAGTGGKP